MRAGENKYIYMPPFTLGENNPKQPKKSVYTLSRTCYDEGMVKSNEKKVIIKHPHTADCWAVKAVARHSWYGPWYLPGEPIFYGDRAGGKRGNTSHWVVFRCNATNCGARGLVRQTVLEDFIHDLTKEQE